MIRAAFGMTCKELDYWESIPQFERGPIVWPIQYDICAGARIIRNALRHLIDGIQDGYGTPAETFHLLHESQNACWEEMLIELDAENHEENYREIQ